MYLLLSKISQITSLRCLGIGSISDKLISYTCELRERKGLSIRAIVQLNGFARALIAGVALAQFVFAYTRLETRRNLANNILPNWLGLILLGVILNMR